MYEHEPWEITDAGESGTAHGKITLVSNGWSGEIVGNDDNSHFQFDVTGEGSYAGDHYNILANGGYVFGGSGQVIGISLEHMGVITETTSNQQTVQFLGMDDNGNLQFVPAWGAMHGDTELTVTHAQIWVESIKINDNEYTERTISNITMPYVYAGIRTLCDGDWYAVDCEIKIETDLPIFATDAELLAWTQDPTNPELIATMLNAPDDPEEAAEEAYAASQRYYYLRNKFKVSTNGSTYTATINNINAKPYGKGRICLYKKKHTQVGTNATWYSYYLKGTGSYAYRFKTAPWNSFRWDDDDTDLSASAALNRVNSVGYIKKSATYKKAGIEFVVEYADTNIPIYGSEELADKYVAEEIDIDQAENYDEILQEEQKHILPPWGDEDIDGDNGTNAQSCEVGHRMFMLSDTRLKEFFDAIYDPTHLQAILDNNGLFGENQMNSILGLTFIPVNANKFATMGGQENIKLGGWDSEVKGQIIQKNNKLWDVGSTFLAPVFNDFRDMEPYQQLFISLPYCGLHALNLSKYLGKTLSVKYACDLGTGQCCAHIYSNGVEYDAFDGNMASQRPITAIDQQAYTSAMMRSITGMIDPAVDLVTGAVESGVGAATGQIGMVAAGGTSALGSIPRMAMSAIESKQDLIQKPMTFKGGFFGAIGLFGNQRCHLIVAQRNTVRAANELSLIGYPSGYGGTVASFSGHLKCASFTLAHGFAGTAEEAAEIVSMMEQGVYL
ncbi:MAG: hypothetical protein UHM23_02530 [Clostridia bacterium]|nr:hypothetical protein [Clostridia bacterium]